MISNHNIICFSSDWHQDPLSKHNIMSRLSRKNRILWINSIGMRNPTASAQDFAKIGTKLKSFFRGLEKVNDNLYVMSPLAIPFHGNALVNRINKVFLSMQVRYYQKRLKLHNPICWTFLPNTVELVSLVSPRLIVYYITDDFTQFTGHPGDAIGRMERDLVEKSDVIIASASRLAEIKSGSGKKIHVVTHGVNFDKFAKALTMTPADWPADICSIKKPIIGFYGEINDWLDLPILAAAAQEKPDWSFVLIGRVAVEVGDIGYLTGLPNVHLLGQKNHDVLPAYCAAFDAGLILRKINELTLSMNPLKMKEYLAAGVPVISPPMPEVLPYKDVVKFASTKEELITAITHILKGDCPSRGELSRRVADEGWDGKVEVISGIIEEAMKKNKFEKSGN